MEGVWQQGFDDDANGFFDLSDRYAHLDAKRDPLVEIATIVPWQEFRPVLERVWRKPDAAAASKAGRKPMDAVVTCLIPRFDGAILSQELRETLWNKFAMAAPRPRTPSELKYSDRKLQSRS